VCNGAIIAEIPSITSIFTILLPTTFPIVSSELPLIEAKTFTISSGAEVPKATIVSPITICEILNVSASEDAPSTRKSAPLINKKNPKTKSTISNVIGIYP
jgi:hypothetical protein